MNRHFKAAIYSGLAVFAASVSAQSSVTIDGVIDLGISKNNSGTASSVNPGTGARDTWSMQQGNASRVRFSGREDLGGGLYASFLLDHRLFVDTGAQNGPVFWGGRSLMSVGGKFGEIYLGREYTPAFWVSLAADPTGWNYVSQLGTRYTYVNFNASSTSLDASSVRHSNTFAYRSPSMSGLSTELALAAGEGARKRVFGANVQYRSGPIYLGFGTDYVDGDNRMYILTGSYNFKVLKALVSLGDAKGGASSSFAAKTATFSVDVPVGGLARVYAGLGRYDPSGSNNTAQKMFIGANYLLSKRTLLYTNFGSAKQDGLTRSSAFDLGVKHTF